MHPDHEQAAEAAIEAMDAPNANERENATRTLRMTPGLTMDFIFRTLRREDLSPEQRARVEQVGSGLFETAPRAALGVRFQAVDAQNGGIRIDSAVPGFPASDLGLLQSGDTLVEAAGIELVTYDDLRAAILAHSPGETMRLRVRRTVTDAEVGADEAPIGERVEEQAEAPAEPLAEPPTEEMTVDVPLGSFSALNPQRPPSPSILIRAWETRLKMEGLREPTLQLPDDAFEGAAGWWGGEAGSGFGGLAAGGVSRSTEPYYGRRGMVATRTRQLSIEAGMNARDLRQQMGGLAGQRERLKVQLGRLEAMQKGQDIAPDARARAMARAIQIQVELQQLDLLERPLRRQIEQAPPAPPPAPEKPEGP